MIIAQAIGALVLLTLDQSGPTIQFSANAYVGGFSQSPSCPSTAIPVAGQAVPYDKLVPASVLRRLNCEEQRLLVEATSDAVRGGVGASEAWESRGRPGVKGVTTITNEKVSASGARCLAVSTTFNDYSEESEARWDLCSSQRSGLYELAAQTVSIRTLARF